MRKIYMKSCQGVRFCSADFLWTMIPQPILLFLILLIIFPTNHHSIIYSPNSISPWKTTNHFAMARTLPIPSVLILVLLSFNVVMSTKHHTFSRSLNPKAIKLKKQKLSHFHFYWHDILSGRNPTAVEVVKQQNTSKTAFGSISMIDDPLTLGPKMSSKMVGRAQGFYASAAQQEVSLMMAMNFVFIEGKYNGSTITILGRNPVFSKMREMPVIGGSGLFRFAKGYAQAKTQWSDTHTKDAIVEYNVFVMHY